MSKPLEGIKVVDLTTFLATPTTGRALGEWGADVIKIEAAKGDPGRVNQAVVFGNGQARVGKLQTAFRQQRNILSHKGHLSEP